MRGMASPISETFQPVRLAASRFGVPAAWLRAEAEAGRLPHLRAGRQILIHPEQVEAALLARARAAAENNHGIEPMHPQELARA